MRSLFIIIIFITFQINSYSQIIKGIIREPKTEIPIPFATVYLNGTFIGTCADQNGNFEISIPKRYKSIPLSISAIGYYSANLPFYSKTDSLIINLEPKIYGIDDVTISTKSLERKRKRNLRLFKNEFLGTTENAQACTILNERDITFNYYSDKDTIKAYALKPILMENKALGYKIKYYLDKFEYYKQSDATFFSGNFLFKEDLSADEEKRNYYNKKREAAYLGSRMHFFRVLWSNELKSSNFLVRDPTFKHLKYKDMVSQDENQNKFLKYSNNILIDYGNRRSVIEFINDSVYFDETGFFNPGIKWWGYMGKQRLADWLPYEYNLKQQ